jgi:hypothetical protein
MDRLTKTIELPNSGYKAEVVTSWTWGEKQEMIKNILGDTTIDASSGTVGEIKASSSIDASNKTIAMAVKSIKNQQGEIVKIELADLPAEDVQLIADHVNEMEKKKVK